jgi:hypothetical protein
MSAFGLKIRRHAGVAAGVTQDEIQESALSGLKISRKAGKPAS